MLNTKHLLSGGAMIASVAIAAPVWAKTAMPVGAVAGVSPMAATVLYKQMPVQDCIVHQRGQHRWGAECRANVHCACRQFAHGRNGLCGSTDVY